MNNIERLLAIEGIKTTKARYFRCLDTKDLAGYASVFAPDAVMDMRGESRDGEGLVSGAGNIASFVLGSVSGLSTVHHGHMPEIEFSSDTSASVIWAMEDKLWKVDDAAAVARQRLALYEKETAPVLDLLAERSLLRRVDGAGYPDEIAARVWEEVRPLLHASSASPVPASY